jgi:hypothetical protein
MQLTKNGTLGALPYSGIPEKILRLDMSIRFCAVVNRLGYVVDSRSRANLQPLLTVEEFGRFALIAAIRHRTRTVLEEKLGRSQCVVTYYEKVILASMPLANDDLLLVTVDATIKNFQVIMRKMLRLLRRYVT